MFTLIFGLTKGHLAVGGLLGFALFIGAKSGLFPFGSKQAANSTGGDEDDAHIGIGS